MTAGLRGHGEQAEAGWTPAPDQPDAQVSGRRAAGTTPERAADADGTTTPVAPLGRRMVVIEAAVDGLPRRAAHRRRTRSAKLFPAHIGGVAHLKSLLAVLPGARIVATGAVTVENTAEWLGADAFTASKGGDIRGKANGLRTLLDGWAASRSVPGARGLSLGGTVRTINPGDRLNDQNGGGLAYERRLARKINL